MALCHSLRSAKWRHAHTSGIGQLATIELARQGAHLVLTARDKAKATATRAAIHAAVPEARVDVHYADFASLDAVAAVAAEIASRYERIDVLINNAGIHAFEQRVTIDGFAEMIAVNYLAPWLLTSILREKLVLSEPSRIVTVASRASRRVTELVPSRDLCDTAPFTRMGSSKMYGQTKLMNIMFSMELARQLQDTGVVVNCLCPGFMSPDSDVNWGLLRRWKGFYAGWASVTRGMVPASSCGSQPIRPSVS